MESLIKGVQKRKRSGYTGLDNRLTEVELLHRTEKQHARAAKCSVGDG
jgi:hypothetical protein